MTSAGYIRDELDLKLLVLYIMSHTAGPITFLQLLDLDPDQIRRVYKAARNRREWLDEHPEINTWEKYVEYSHAAKTDD